MKKIKKLIKLHIYISLLFSFKNFKNLLHAKLTQYIATAAAKIRSLEAFYSRNYIKDSIAGRLKETFKYSFNGFRGNLEVTKWKSRTLRWI